MTTAVEYIEKGIKARERYWHDQYQQGYQRALSDIMTLLEDAKQMEKEQIKEAYCKGDDNIGAEQYYNETYKR